MPTVNLGIAAETSSALSIKFAARLFAFPNQGQFNASAILGPRWKIHFFNAGTDTPRTVYATPDFVIAHAAPVVLDRRGALPTIYIENGFDYRIVVENEFGVQRHEISSFVWPHQTRRLAILGVEEETDTAQTVVPARAASLGIAEETDSTLAVTPA